MMDDGTVVSSLGDVGFWSYKRKMNERLPFLRSTFKLVSTV